jgi:hypothetical protein
MINTIALQSKTLEELARKIEEFQNSNDTLISKGSIPFSSTFSFHKLLQPRVLALR